MDDVLTAVSEPPVALSRGPLGAVQVADRGVAGVARGVPLEAAAEQAGSMTEAEYAALRERAARGDRDARDELIETAGERGDLAQLRRLADQGDTTATDELVQLASQQGDLAELRRLADQGSGTAADELVQVFAELGDLDELRRLAERGNRDAADVLAELSED